MCVCTCVVHTTLGVHHMCSWMGGWIDVRIDYASALVVYLGVQTRGGELIARVIAQMDGVMWRCLLGTHTVWCEPNWANGSRWRAVGARPMCA